MYHSQIAATYSIRIALGCAMLSCAQTGRAAGETSPYQARVIAAGAAVHSGPGENFYSTDTLAQGDTVEIYREKPGGWLAIRPPVNSFSWVAGRDLILKDGGLAEAVKDNVASRIGSRINDRHNASQVRLKKGEAVEVLGEENINGEKWYKIAPPAGEFRWIQASVVERIGPIQNSSAASSLAATSPQASDAKANSPAPTATTPAASASGGSGAPPLLPTAKPSDPIATTTTTATTATAAASPVASGQPVTSQVPSDLPHELAAIELRLSRMAAAPPNLWNTERLEHDVAQLQARAKTQADRDAIRVTQEKVNHFAEICRRNSQSPANVAQSGQAPITPVPNSVAPTASGGPYDAVGILRPVVSRRPGAPQFALVDERGQVVSFVTASPDLNLQPYLGHRIGVVGNRGFIPEFQRSNVTAARVTPLNDRLVR